jgi:hypothetical protein
VDCDFNENGYDEFWSKEDFGDGCSGPSGNVGSTREKWYKKKVLVVWISDRSLAIKCKCDISAGVTHDLQLSQNKKIEEAVKGVDFLVSSACIPQLCESNVINLL